MPAMPTARPTASIDPLKSKPPINAIMTAYLKTLLTINDLEPPDSEFMLSNKPASEDLSHTTLPKHIAAPKKTLKPNLAETARENISPATKP